MNRVKREKAVAFRKLPVDIALMTASALMLAGCVTINIYFPAAAAEKMADKIIDEVWQAQKDGTLKHPSAPAAATNVPGKENK